jgi:hypothetical protein
LRREGLVIFLAELEKDLSVYHPKAGRFTPGISRMRKEEKVEKGVNLLNDIN